MQNFRKKINFWKTFFSPSPTHNIRSKQPPNRKSQFRRRTEVHVHPRLTSRQPRSDRRPQLLLSLSPNSKRKTTTFLELSRLTHHEMKAAEVICKYSQTCVPYNNHPHDPKFVAVVDRGSLFRGSFTL